MHPSFPQRFAAASLKPSGRHVSRTTSSGFSAAFCCGLIEAEGVFSDKNNNQFVFRSVLLRPH